MYVSMYVCMYVFLYDTTVTLWFRRAGFKVYDFRLEARSSGRGRFRVRVSNLGSLHVCNLKAL